MRETDRERAVGEERNRVKRKKEREREREREKETHRKRPEIVAGVISSTPTSPQQP